MELSNAAAGGALDARVPPRAPFGLLSRGRAARRCKPLTTALAESCIDVVGVEATSVARDVASRGAAAARCALSGAGGACAAVRESTRERSHLERNHRDSGYHLHRHHKAASASNRCDITVAHGSTA